MIIGKVGGLQALLNSAGKMNTSMPEVRQGCGVWKNKKKYDRNRSKSSMRRGGEY